MLTDHRARIEGMDFKEWKNHLLILFDFGNSYL